MRANNIRIFDYPKFAMQFRDIIRTNIEQIAEEQDLDIEYLRDSSIRKEALIAQKIVSRGDQPGIVHILSAMELCPCFRRHYDKSTKRSSLKYGTSKCIHYYIYFIDQVYGLCYLRIPTWLPCRLQFYFNGHSWLAQQLDCDGIPYEKLDNAFSWIADWERAQQIADQLDINHLHQTLDSFAHWLCPIADHFSQTFHWSVTQAEYASDISFKRQQDLQAIYDELVRTAIHTVKPDNIATFLGKKQLHGNSKEEVGNRYNIRIEGSRIRHQMGKQSIKMYDKFKKILRIESVTYDISFFKHYRMVEHKDGTSSNKFAALKKNIYSLKPLRSILKAANRRYLEFISAIEDKNVGKKRLKKITQPVKHNKRNYRGLNFFNPDDDNLLQAIARGEFNIYGFKNKDLRVLLGKSSSQVSRLLKSLRLHGLIRKARNTYKYYLTKLGKEAILTGQKLKELVIIPKLNY
jgi:hypothetical protein